MAMPELTEEEARELIRKWFPVLLREDISFREEIMGYMSGVLATKDDIARILSSLEGHSRILEEHSKAIQDLTRAIQEHSRILEEHSKTIEDLTRAVQEHSRILEEHSKTIQEHSRILEEHSKTIEDLTRAVQEHSRILEEHSKTIQEHSRILEEHSKTIQEHSRILEEHSKTIEELSKTIQEHSRVLEEHTKRIEKFERTLSAIGARWGVLAEESFRAAMRGVLEDLGYRVRKWRMKDESGTVYGFPSMVEADILIVNDKHILIEIKSSISRGDVATFARIVRLYEEREGISPRPIIVSPFIDTRARVLGEQLGIELYTSPEEVAEQG
jgi:hypothetical protein